MEESGWLILGVTIGVGVLAHFLVLMEFTVRNAVNHMPYIPWIAVVGTVFFVQASMMIVKAKNRDWKWGFLGLLSVPGVLLAYLIGVRCRGCGAVYGRFKPGCPTCRPGLYVRCDEVRDVDDSV